MGNRKPLKFNLRFQTLLNAEGGLSSEIQLFKLGKFTHWSGDEFEINEESMEQFVENFERFKEEAKDKDHVIPIDYNHGSLDYGVDVSKAAGWIDSLSIKEDGLYAKVSWTKSASELIKEKEFRFVSPEFSVDPTDEYGETLEGCVLYAAALTNRPFLKGMAPVTLNAKNKTQKGGISMKDKLITIFSLRDNASEESVLSVVKDQQEKLSDLRKTLGLKDGEDVSKAVGKLAKDKDDLEKAVKSSTDELLKFKQAEALKAAEAKVEEGVKAGKILKKGKDAWLKLAQENPEQFDSLLEASPVVADFKKY